MSVNTLHPFSEWRESRLSARMASRASPCARLRGVLIDASSSFCRLQAMAESSTAPLEKKKKDKEFALKGGEDEKDDEASLEEEEKLEPADTKVRGSRTHLRGFMLASCTLQPSE